MFLRHISNISRDEIKSDTNLDEKAKSDSLVSISAVVKRQEEIDIYAEYDVESYNSDEDSDTDPYTDDEEYQCAVCKLDFVGEAKFEQHRRVSQHWG